MPQCGALRCLICDIHILCADLPAAATACRLPVPELPARRAVITPWGAVVHRVRPTVVALIVNGLWRLYIHRLRLVIDRRCLYVNRLWLNIHRLLHVNRALLVACDNRANHRCTHHSAKNCRPGTPTTMSGCLPCDSRVPISKATLGMVRIMTIPRNSAPTFRPAPDRR